MVKARPLLAAAGFERAAPQVQFASGEPWRRVGGAAWPHTGVFAHICRDLGVCLYL